MSTMRCWFLFMVCLSNMEFIQFIYLDRLRCFHKDYYLLNIKNRLTLKYIYIYLICVGTCETNNPASNID